VELDQLDHEPVVRAGNSSPLLDKLFSFFVIIAQFKNNIGRNDRD
jgi:hypothetical protein